MMTFTLTGTTYTGHPTATTFGNTWRMFFYTKFISKQENFNMKSVHAGDDVTSIVETSGETNIKYKQSIFKYVKSEPPQEYEEYGLG
jgi:hypothetical protein